MSLHTMVTTSIVLSALVVAELVEVSYWNDGNLARSAQVYAHTFHRAGPECGHRTDFSDMCQRYHLHISLPLVSSPVTQSFYRQLHLIPSCSYRVIVKKYPDRFKFKMAKLAGAVGIAVFGGLLMIGGVTGILLSVILGAEFVAG